MAAAAIAQALRVFKKVSDEVDPDELREQLGEALDDPDVRTQLEAKPHSMIVGASFRLLTAAMLRYVWPLLISFVYLDFLTGGLALAYLNLHFYMRHFANRKGFAPLGSEWRPWRALLGWPSFALKYAEMGFIIVFDILVFILFLMLITIISMLVYAITHPCEFVARIGYAHAAVMASLAGPTGIAAVAACGVVNAVSG